ncbi:MAG: NAD-dependent epimerase/dehydratase family protein [Flavobacteriaceae bacterium]|jgi:nucleoside-diphosphate-sugar epimerase|nr:NAD-dependent epimerase/dehydratase family protein [Flavobacteriaceae bacterium]
MIIGNGLIANLFKNSDMENIVFFASGVSNSLETNVKEFLREENLLRKTISENPEKIFVYFSTCSIYDSSKNNSPYVLHKLKMEEIVKTETEIFLILRVSNAVGNGGNPNLLMNYLVRSVKNNDAITVHTKATRNLINADDIKNLTLQLLEGKNFNKIINIAYLQNYSILEILEILESFFNLKLNLNLVKAGSGYEINIPDVENYFRKNNLTNKEIYLKNILEKYYD